MINLSPTVESTYKQISKSTNDVLDIDDVKQYMRISSTMQDNIIELMIDAAVGCAERYMNRDILTTTYENYRRDFSPDLTLRRGGFQSLDLIEYLKDGSYTTLATTEYTLREGGVFGEICEVCPPSDMDCDCNAVKITFKTGFGDDSDSVPADIKLALYQIIFFINENRGDCSCVSESIPEAAMKMLNGYKIISAGYQ